VKYLLDVNVLIALLDQEHVFHARAEDWFADHAPRGWATSPHTENGVLRILGSPRYPQGASTPAAAAELVRSLTDYGRHEFWPDEISILTSRLVNSKSLANSAHVTDTYLLALAVHNKGRLATFDRRLSAGTVTGGADAVHLIA
jgi:hypothetical protein